MRQIERPRRLSPAAAPGVLLKRAFGIAQRMRLRETAERNPVYLALVRQCPCLHCGQDPAGEAAHVRMASGAHGKVSGIGKKPADKWVLPLCAEHHREADNSQHKIGERAFWGQLGINPLLVCKRLYAARGDLVAMRAMIFVAIAERSRRRD